ncbi:hypothetical protein QQ045_007505 [Rhodiola kirilowii]
MLKLQGFDQSKEQQHGWNKISREYNNHLTQMMRTTSVLPDVPRYPGVHNIFKKKAVTSSKDQSSLPKAAKKKVHIAEQENTIICNNSGNSGTFDEITEESIDADADSFIQQKHAGFELCKWTTFKRAR